MAEQIQSEPYPEYLKRKGGKPPTTVSEPLASEPYPEYLKRKKAEAAAGPAETEEVEETDPGAGEVPERPGENESREVWAEYVSELGGDPGELKRDELIDAADELLGTD